MSFGDFFILAAVAAGIFFAVRSMIRQRKSGGCVGCSGCTGCSGNCAKCGKDPE